MNTQELTKAFFETPKGKGVLEDLNDEYIHRKLVLTQSKYFLESSIGKAFLELEERGFLISMECGENGGDGRAKMESEAGHPYIFFNRLEFRDLVSTGSTYLHFGGVILETDDEYDSDLDIDLREEQVANVIKNMLKKYGINSWDDGAGHVYLDLGEKYAESFSLYDLIYKANIHLFSHEKDELILRFLGGFIKEDEFISIDIDPKDKEINVYKHFNDLFNQTFDNFHTFFRELLLNEDWIKFDTNWMKFSDIPDKDKSDYLNDLYHWEQAYHSIEKILDEESLKVRISRILKRGKQEIDFIIKDK